MTRLQIMNDGRQSLAIRLRRENFVQIAARFTRTVKNRKALSVYKTYRYLGIFLSFIFVGKKRLHRSAHSLVEKFYQTTLDHGHL